MKSLREQVEEKLGIAAKDKRHFEKRTALRKPLIVTPAATHQPLGKSNGNPVKVDVDDEFERLPKTLIQSSSMKDERVIKGESSINSQKEESELKMKHVWSHQGLLEESTPEEKSNLQLVDKILARYGSHQGRKSGNRQYQEVKDYLNYHIQKDFSHIDSKNKKKRPETNMRSKKSKTQQGSFEQDADSFPKSYLPIAHPQDDQSEGGFNNSIKVREVLQKAIRPHLQSSAKRSTQQSHTSSTDKNLLFDKQKVKEILVQKKAINLYQSELSSVYKREMSDQLSQGIMSRNSHLAQGPAFGKEVSEHQSDEISCQGLDFGDKIHGVPIFTCKSS
jgi:hypothetical protein